MATYMISNQHLAEDCDKLAGELATFYGASAEEPNVQCTCMAGEHEMFFLVSASGPSEALGAIPPAFRRISNTVKPVEDAYAMATS